jgi:hypothetical protein
MIVLGSCKLSRVFAVRFLQDRENNQMVLESIEDGGSDSLSYGTADEKSLVVEAGAIITPAKAAVGIL